MPGFRYTRIVNLTLSFLAVGDFLGSCWSAMEGSYCFSAVSALVGKDVNCRKWECNSNEVLGGSRGVIPLNLQQYVCTKMSTGSGS